MGKEIQKKCSNCVHWNNKQSELDYSSFYGICTCFKWKFTTTNIADCVVLDRENRNSKYMGVNRFENRNETVPFGQCDKSRYCLVTEEKFCCIHHKTEKQL